jgi:uncharacterized protein with ParB-like and HNH nuclease domain
MKLKNFCMKKELVSKSKRSQTEWEKIFATYTSDKGLITRIDRGLRKLNSLKTNETIKKWETSKEEIEMGKKTHEKMLIIPGHKGNPNQNHTEILPHSC